jgi:acyl-CoA reductase-like NAD-dependent aldehyde dehydrogenase
VHQDVFQPFLDGFVAGVHQYRLGDPLDPDTSLGPMSSAMLAGQVRGQVQQAIAAGATRHIEPQLFPRDAPGSAYLMPQVLTGVDHKMAIMREETFGPAIGLMPVGGDDEALGLMNDSDLGLTASIWTADLGAAERLGAAIETGTVFMNRCDYLDPALAWTGRRQSGRGAALGPFGFESVTRLKSYHFRTG